MRNLLLSLSLLLTLLSESRISYVTALGDVMTSSIEAAPIEEIVPLRAELTANFRTATGKTILFKAPAQEEIIESESPNYEIPHLVLKRNGVPTPGFERTLIVSLNDLAIPQSGVYVRLAIETQHRDPDLDRKNNTRVEIWEETRFIPYDALSEQGDNVQFKVTFNPVTKLSHKTIKTPTDYYRCQIVVSDSQGKQLQSYTEDYAFLMENQWRVPLPEMLEATPGAAPDELLVYYYDMVLFQAHLRNPDTQVPRQDVDRYIQTELIPQMVKAIEIQSNLWDLPWYKEWSNYRMGEAPKTLSVALGGYRTWFHGSAPSLGHAMISIRVDGGFGEYSTLTDGIMSVFHHELFHNQQRNISLHFEGKGNVSGKEKAWELFSEGTAVLASSVGQPAVQFEAMAYSRSYMKRANAFLGSEGAVGGGLNKSYKDIPYHIALYWRFLYENCGGITAGGEDPRTGMKVIRYALETLYKGEIVQINASTNMASAFPHIMDRALQSTPSCAFRTYEESLIHFARAIYMLRLEDGRCSSTIEQSHCGLRDPHHLYQTPPADVIAMTANAPTEVSGFIPSSYGIDLIEVELNSSMQGKNLQFVFTNLADSKFHVEVWKTRTINRNGVPERQSAQTIEPISVEAENGSLIFEVQNLNNSDFDGLGMIITRMDPYENEETTGAYSIQLIAE
jgi:hypothetical protein